MLKAMTLAVLFAASTLTAQQPQTGKFGEKVDVNLVLLDAVVTDSRGNQILGLDKDDFVVKENGVALPVNSVDYFTNRQLLNGPESKAAFKVERVHDQRYFVFFFDKPTSGAMFFDRLSQARYAVKNFIKNDMKPTDYAAIVADDVRLKVYSDFTNDKQQLTKAVDETAMWGRGITQSNAAPDAPSLLRGASSRIIDDTGTVYEALQVIGEQLRPIHARKNIVLFSAGIVEQSEQIQHGMVVGPSRYYDPMIRALNRADVTVYPISLLDNSDAPPFVHQTLDRIAGDTNGQYFRFNTSFGPPLRQIDKLSTGYYLISYYTEPKHGSGYQKVNVAVKNPEFRVRARQGYSYGD